ncbi:MAG: histidine kinase [Candidatus Eremiobacteraeota bacterium]|nr:histidine kinase [Candidatus Eremiobacteraeota bacterium]
MNRRLPLVVRLLPVFALVGLASFLYRYLDDLTRHLSGTLPMRLLEQSTGIFSALVVVPIALGVARRVPWTRAGWPRALLAQLAGAVLYTVIHTTLMALSRAVLAPLFGLGPYDYGDMLWRYPMEASNDVVDYAVVAALVYFFGREERARKAELAAAELRAQLAQATLENLRLQLNPHFLFNALNAISSVMYEDVRRADTMLARLSEFLRTVLASDAQQVPLGDELDVERMYVDVMTARLEQALRFEVRVDPAVRDAVVPFLVLQPLLENAIRHGMAGERETIAITVEVARERETTVISVADDGVGLRGSTRRGLGIANVESRLRGLFDGAASFTLADAPEGGARATLRFPFAAARGPSH